MSLHHALRYAMPGYEVLKPWWYWSNEDSSYMSCDELGLFRRIHPFVSGVGGHTTRPYAGYEKVVTKPIFYFTFLREPIQRYLSHLNHQTNKMNIEWTVESFLAESRFNNLMTRRIAGSEDIDLARRILRDKFGMVGLFESFDESLVILSRLLFGTPTALRYEHMNDSEGELKIKLEDLPRKVQAIIINNNMLDTELYTYAKDKLLPQYVNAYSGNLPTDVEAFRLDNSSYTYNSFKWYLLRVLKVYSENIPQRAAHWLKKT